MTVTTVTQATIVTNSIPIMFLLLLPKVVAFLALVSMEPVLPDLQKLD